MSTLVTLSTLLGTDATPGSMPVPTAGGQSVLGQTARPASMSVLRLRKRIAARIEWYYTPERGSWLNIAECELLVLARRCLARRVPNQVLLAHEVSVWDEERNSAQVRVDWQFTAQDARTKLKQLYPVVKEQSLC